MTFVNIYTDGACRGNPGPGGWAAILVTEADGKKFEKELSGGEKLTTNNRMELTAAIEGLAALKYRCRVELVSDSKYLCDAVNLGWAKSWQKRGWIKSDKKPALNPDLWERLLELLDAHDVEVVWVRGHAGHEYNERCDALATAMADSFKD
ncbi:MAG: ribonuclease HI [Eubacteriales bacterium]|jgi:ribonuclease HI